MTSSESAGLRLNTIESPFSFEAVNPLINNTKLITPLSSSFSTVQCEVSPEAESFIKKMGEVHHPQESEHQESNAGLGSEYAKKLKPLKKSNSTVNDSADDVILVSEDNGFIQKESSFLDKIQHEFDTDIENAMNKFQKQKRKMKKKAELFSDSEANNSKRKMVQNSIQDLTRKKFHSNKQETSHAPQLDLEPFNFIQILDDENNTNTSNIPKSHAVSLL